MNKKLIEMSRTKEIATIALLSTVSLILRLTVEIPFPLATYLKLEIWEIPAYVALIAYGPRLGIGTALIVFLSVQAFVTGLPLGPFYNLIAVISTMGGILFGANIANKLGLNVTNSRAFGASLVFGTLSRTIIMTIVNFIVLPQPFPIGYEIPVEALPPILGYTALFNIIVATYSIIIAKIITERILPIIKTSK